MDLPRWEQVGGILVPPGFVWNIPGQIATVKDGDSFTANMILHPFTGGQLHDVDIRAEGIDAIEKSDRYGAEATAYAKSLLTPGLPVMFLATRKEKYGRFLLRTIFSGGREFGQEMLLKKASDGATPLAMPFLVR